MHSGVVWAVGTPILVGVKKGLDGPAIIEYAASNNMDDWTQLLPIIGAKVAMLHALSLIHI